LPAKLRRDSVDRPHAGSCELEEIIVRIAEINAGAAARPADTALDLDPLGVESFFPGAKVFRQDRERKVQRAAAVVRSKLSEGQLCDTVRCASLEQEQNASPANAVCTEPCVTPPFAEG